MATAGQSIEPPPDAVREGTYGDRVIAVEPGGVGFIPLDERHGRPRQMFWTWASPNLEFATIFVGVIAVAAFGLSFWAATAAIVIGTGIGALSHGFLSTWGPRLGVPQMVLSRVGFGYRGNVLPAGLHAATAGIGWFAVNSVSGTLALNTLTGLPKVPCLVLISVVQLVIAFFGHNLVHAFERYAFPVLALIFGAALVVILAKAPLGAGGSGGVAGGGVAGFLMTVGASFGYTAGWNPYATDYTRYLPPAASKRATGLAAGLGMFISVVLLQVMGAASAALSENALGDPTGSLTGPLPALLADLTLLAIALGAISANVINVYSGAMSFVALGIHLPIAARRAISALGFGLVGFIAAYFGLRDAGAAYTSFLLVVSYWVGPWLAVVLADYVQRRGEPIERYFYDTRYANWAGPIAMAVGMVVSILLFSNQSRFVGYLVREVPSLGDITFGVGFVVAAALYLVLFPRFARRGEAVTA